MPIPNGLTLEALVTALATRIGWEAMAEAVPIRCFMHEPSVQSSLKFLRRTPWARVRVEVLYMRVMRDEASEHIADKPKA